MLKFWGITGPESAQSTLKWAAAVSHGIPRICRGEPRNFANGAAEFGKICREKMWALFIILFIHESITRCTALNGSLQVWQI